MQSLRTLIIYLPVILLALTLHEVAHGYVAYLLGDPTPKYYKRLSLNPLVHIDPIGFIFLLVAHIGWAKPVPVNPMYFKNPERDVVFVALAGPLMNFLTGGLALILLRFTAPLISGIISSFLIAFAIISFVLCFFNLIPLPPLDGWRVLSYFIKNSHTRYEIERKGPMLLIAVLLVQSLLNLRILDLFIIPAVNFSFKLFLGYNLGIIG